MTRPTTALNGKCMQPDRVGPCPMTCKYNHFERGDLTIDAWELKCADCGWRETTGYRTDEPDPDDPADPTQCPYCRLCNLAPGTNPCQTGN